MRCAPTAGAVLVLCAATAGLLSAQARPASPEPPRFASWEEMNVLAHGLLQLGRGLHEHVERTRGQLSALERRLAACGAACQGSEATAATPKDPENPIASGETAPETLRSLQVGSADGCVCVCVFGGSASALLEECGQEEKSTSEALWTLRSGLKGCSNGSMDWRLETMPGPQQGLYRSTGTAQASE